MKIGSLSRYALQGAISLLLVHHASAALEGYWPLDETEGFVAPNSVAGGIEGILLNGVEWVNDPVRGQVLQFDGVDGFVHVGDTTIPQMTLTNNFTWSFWSNSTLEPMNGTVQNNNTIIGNRYRPEGGEWDPREFIKFTQTNFEYHRSGASQNLNYADMAPGAWMHSMLVKQGSKLTYFRNGMVIGSSTITEGLNNPQPLYFGGNANLENWQGSLDDVAIWSDAIPLSSVARIAKGLAAPDEVATVAAPFVTTKSEDFSNLDQWNVTDRGLENNAPAGYNAPDVTDGKLTLGGTATSQYWFGTSVESKFTLDSNIETLVSVDRLSLTGTGRFRSSLWIIGDGGHYLHFGQNMNEGGWGWNARDDGGLGTLNPTGSGNNIASLDSLDADGGQHTMALQLVPTGIPGDVFIHILLDGNIVASQNFTNFPETFTVALTGQARAIGDSVSAEFDNLVVQQTIPEPSAAMLLGCAAVGLFGRRRRK